jgi:hypothetical protein
MPENISDLQYMSVKEETTSGTPVTPTIYIPLFEEDVTVDVNPILENLIIGNRFKTYQALQGFRSHGGTVKTIAEPNTSLYIWSMLLKRGSVSGSGPYTWPFTVDVPVSSFTVDIAKGRLVQRYWGVKASQIKSSFQDGELQYDVAIQGVGSFITRKITNVSSNVLTLDTTYDAVPTKGLVASDLVRIFLASGAVVDTTVVSVTNTTVTVASAGGAAANDYICLRPVSAPSFSLQRPFLLPQTEFRFGATASAAASAAHTGLEVSPEWMVSHDFATDTGEVRSGSFDPVALVHTEVDAEVKGKVFFDTPAMWDEYQSLTKRALVIKHLSTLVSGTNQELRITLNNIKQINAKAPLKTGDIIYDEFTYKPQYDTTDGQGLSVTIINSLSAF